MKKREVLVIDEVGLHIRPASLIAKAAQNYECNTILIKDGKEYNAKSIVSLLSMGASKGTSLIIKAEGVNEEKAVDCLAQILQSSFD